MMRRLTVQRIYYPPDEDDLTLGTGTDLASSESIRFVVPPDAALGVLASLHSGNRPEIDVHDIDVVDWSMWWEEV